MPTFELESSTWPEPSLRPPFQAVRAVRVGIPAPFVWGRPRAEPSTPVRSQGRVNRRTTVLATSRGRRRSALRSGAWGTVVVPVARDRAGTGRPGPTPGRGLGALLDAGLAVPRPRQPDRVLLGDRPAGSGHPRGVVARRAARHDGTLDGLRRPVRHRPVAAGRVPPVRDPPGSVLLCVVGVRIGSRRLARQLGRRDHHRPPRDRDPAVVVARAAPPRPRPHRDVDPAPRLHRPDRVVGRHRHGGQSSPRAWCALRPWAVRRASRAVPDPDPGPALTQQV